MKTETSLHFTMLYRMTHIHDRLTEIMNSKIMNEPTRRSSLKFDDSVEFENSNQNLSLKLSINKSNQSRHAVVDQCLFTTVQCHNCFIAKCGVFVNLFSNQQQGYSVVDLHIRQLLETLPKLNTAMLLLTE